MHDSLHSFRARNLTFPSSFVVIDRALITSQEFRCVWISLFERGHALRSRTPSLAFNYEDMRDLASKFASSNETALFPGISVRYSFLRVQSKLQKRSCPAAIKRFQLRFQRFSTFVRISRHIVARIFRVSKFLHEKPCKLYLVFEILRNWNISINKLLFHFNTNILFNLLPDLIFTIYYLYCKWNISYPSVKFRFLYAILWFQLCQNNIFY